MKSVAPCTVQFVTLAAALVPLSALPPSFGLRCLRCCVNASNCGEGNSTLRCCGTVPITPNLSSVPAGKPTCCVTGQGQTCCGSSTCCGLGDPWCGTSGDGPICMRGPPVTTTTTTLAPGNVSGSASASTLIGATTATLGTFMLCACGCVAWQRRRRMALDAGFDADSLKRRLSAEDHQRRDSNENTPRYRRESNIDGAAELYPEPELEPMTTRTL